MSIWENGRLLWRRTPWRNPWESGSDVEFDFLAGVLDSRLTYARNDNVGTRFNSSGILETLSANQPRFDYDPNTLEPLGILIEESRTNLVANSVDMSAEFTTAYNVNETSTTETAPDGTSTATTIEDDSGATFERMHRNYNTGAGVVFSVSNTYTFSIFCKKTSGATHFPCIQIAYAGGANPTSTNIIVFNTNTGAVTSGTGTVKSIGNFWRFTVSKAVDYADRTILFVVFYPAYNLDGSSTLNGSATGAQTVWGAQLELGEFATSYIPTAGSTAQRQADALSCTGSNFSSWYRQDAGTLLSRFRFTNTLTGNVVDVSDNTANNRISLRGTGAISQCGVSAVVGGASQVAANNGAVALNTAVKECVAYALNNYAVSVNGTAPTADVSATVPTVDRLYVGCTPWGGAPLNGHIASVKYWRQRIPDAALQVLTS